MLMYIQVIGRMLALPNGAAHTAPSLRAMAAWPDRNGLRCDLTPIGPTPGPPPPCGMQKVLCRFRCDTSPPKAPGAATPTSAFMLAPSMYTWPPCECTISHSSLMPSSDTPWVDGYVTITHARFLLCCSAFAFRSARSTLPFSSQAVTTTCMFTIEAEAGLVPWADDGIRQMLRWPSPRDWWYFWITSRPAYSPCEPAFGCSDTAA